MSTILAQLVTGLNAVVNRLSSIVLAPVAWLPGWLSATLIAIVTGIVMLVVFKHTSNQPAIRQTRRRIKANLLALSLFKDELRVALRCQWSLVLGAGKLLALSVVPMLVMLVPMCLLLGQLAVWYQARPLAIGEQAVVTVTLAENVSPADVTLVSSPGARVSTGPVRVPVKQMVCWKLEAVEAGCHEMEFQIEDQRVTKQVAIGDGFMPVSVKRPAGNVTDVVLHPRERPFSGDSPVQSIEVDFPERSSWTSGTDSWLVYWFLTSLVAAFVARPMLKVNI